MVYGLDPDDSEDLITDDSFTSEIFLESFPRLQKVKAILVPREIAESAQSVAKVCKAKGELPALRSIQVTGSSGEVIGIYYEFE